MMCESAAVAFTWLLTMSWMGGAAAVLVGLGALLSVSLLEDEHPDLLRSFWWGVVAALVFTFTWNLVLPVDGGAAAALAALGVAGWVRCHQPLVNAARRALRTSPVSVACFFAAWAALPWVSLQPLTCIDADLYYIAAVEWHATLPQVPGLQATHPLAVMNGGGFLLAAALGTGPFAHQGHLVFNALLAWWGLPWAVAGLERLARGGSVRAWAVTLAAAPGVDALTSDRMSCPSLDLGVVWLGVAMAAFAFPGRTRLPTRSALAFVLLTPLFKLSLAPLALFFAAALLLTHRPVPPWRALAGVVLGVSLAWLPFAIGNVITSGYPLYPSTAFAVPVSWALPRALVEQVNHVIRSYSAHDGIVGDAGPWGVFERLLLMNRAVLLPVVLLLTATVVAAVRRRGLTLLALAWCYGVAWFVIAPDPRFAGAGLWAWGAVAVAAALRRGEPWRSSLAESPGGRGLALLAGAVLLLGDVPQLTMPPVPSVRPERPVNKPGDWSTLVDGTPFISCSDPAINCFTLPCGGLFPAGLRRRDVNDLSRGFVLPADAPALQLKMQ